MNGKTFEDAVINNRAWDDSCWSTKIDGDRFYHHMRNAPAGHFDSIFLYKDWDGQCVTATLYRIRVRIDLLAKMVI
jgi:Ser-tRNA(Ala) deacylase AlaX